MKKNIKSKERCYSVKISGEGYSSFSIVSDNPVDAVKKARESVYNLKSSTTTYIELEEARVLVIVKDYIGSLKAVEEWQIL